MNRRDPNDYRPNILKFDISYSQRAGTTPNGFAYCTQIVMNVFRRYIKQEGKLADFRDDGLIAAGATPSISRQIRDEDNRSKKSRSRRAHTLVGREVGAIDRSRKVLLAELVGRS